MQLSLEGISHRYQSVDVLEDVSLDLNKGEVICLLGPSGCGKSTLLRIAAGVEQPSRGTVSIAGRPVSAPGVDVPPEDRDVGLMFQDFALFPHLRIEDNVAFGLRGASSKRLTRARALLDRVGLSTHIGRYPHQLSGGEQQRVALARALAPRPSILLMDEPFSGLDNRLRDGIRDQTLRILREEGSAVMMVTHAPEEAMSMADKIALMRLGRIVQIGKPFELYSAPVDKEAAMFFSDINSIPGHVQDQEATTRFGRFPAAGLRNGTNVDVVIRPQHLRLEFDRSGQGPQPSAREGVAARARVVNARFLGGQSLVDLALEQDGLPLKAIVPGVFVPKPGQLFWLSLPRNRCHVFPIVEN
ncbi:MAG: ABC transporter ATP-binding protein [Pseudomonadota bacterium]